MGAQFVVAQQASFTRSIAPDLILPRHCMRRHHCRRPVIAGIDSLLKGIRNICCGWGQ